jgi:hypothetical protein
MCANHNYYCDCTEYCQPPRQVSRRTYFTHAVYRQGHIQSALDDFLAECNIDTGPPLADRDEDMSDDEDISDDHDEAHLDVQQDVNDMHDNFDKIYANAVPPLPLDLEAARLGDLASENLYVNHMHAPDDNAAGRAVHFFLACLHFPIKLLW